MCWNTIEIFTMTVKISSYMPMNDDLYMNTITRAKSIRLVRYKIGMIAADMLSGFFLRPRYRT